MAGPAMTAGRADMAQLQRRRASGSRYSPDPETMGQRKRIRPRSGDNGPAQADTAQLQRQWASLSRYGPAPETMGQRKRIQPRSRDHQLVGVKPPRDYVLDKPRPIP